MNCDRFLKDIDWIGYHIAYCITEEQQDTIKKFYQKIINKEYYPEISQESIDKALDSLDWQLHLRELGTPKGIICQ